MSGKRSTSNAQRSTPNKELLNVAQAALLRLRSTNIMGGCATCATTKPGTHKSYCIVPKLERAIRRAK